MSTKGLSVTAARHLIDRLAGDGLVAKVLVLHDFDVTGFAIFGTLGSDGRRYVYENDVAFIDLGLRLADIDGLQSEPVEIKGDLDVRAETLRGHGATEEEIDYLLGFEDGQPRRVELNAMTSRQFINFLEAKLATHGVRKIIPDEETIERHARRLLEKQLANAALDDMRQQIMEGAASMALPDDLQEQIRRILKEDAALSWDQALAMALKRKPD